MLETGGGGQEQQAKVTLVLSEPHLVTEVMEEMDPDKRESHGLP